jgi:predicted transcriptional regulator
VELAVLDFLWKSGDGNVREVHAAIGRSRGISTNTVGSAMERLFKKFLVTRQKVSHSYRYSPALERQAFQARKVVEAAGGLRALRKSGVLAAFVDLVAGADEDALSELERLIQARRDGR